MRSIVSIFLLAVLFSATSCKTDSNASEPATTENITAQPGAVSDAAATGNAEASATTPTGPTTTMTMDNSDHNFGTVKEGDVIETSFKVTNSGTEPLVITSCKASCGCTTPVCPTSPIAPGQSVDIPVRFDTKGKPGNQSKDVTITANTVPAQSKFRIHGVVEKVAN